MVRTPKQQRAKTTVDAIIEAAFICVAERGSSDTTTRHIADTAGVGVGSVYEYFTDKEMIFEAMNQRFVKEVVGMIMSNTSALSKKNSDEVIRELLSKLKEFLCKNDELYLKLIRQTNSFDLRHYIEPVEKALRELLMAYVMNHPEGVRVRNIPAASYTFIYGGIFSIVNLLSDPAPPVSFDELADGLANIIGHYVSKELEIAAQSS